jgi:hypothetical protein
MCCKSRELNRSMHIYSLSGRQLKNERTTSTLLMVRHKTQFNGKAKIVGHIEMPPTMQAIIFCTKYNLELWVQMTELQLQMFMSSLILWK